jgi:hypothetical protein
MADFLTVGSTARIAWDNCLKARQIAASIVAQVATRGDFANRWQSLESDADLLAQAIANNGNVGTSILSPAQAYDAALALHARYFALAGEAATILDVPNTVPPPVSVDGVIVRTAESAFSTLLSLAIVGAAGYFLYKWATKQEDYPRHLAPRYAGGSRRL